MSDEPKAGLLDKLKRSEFSEIVEDIVESLTG